MASPVYRLSSILVRFLLILAAILLYVLIIMMSFLKKLTRIVSPDDPLYNLVPESMREPQQEDVHLVRADQEQPSANDVKPDDFTLDFDSHLLVMGVLQLQLLQLPIQPRRFSEWTVALRKGFFLCATHVQSSIITDSYSNNS